MRKRHSIHRYLHGTPLGVDSAAPRFSWKLRVPTGVRGARQTAWRILAASTREVLATRHGDLWDSGRVESVEQLHLPYAGQPLVSTEQVFWQVRVWDADGNASPWSEPQTFTMAVLKAADWASAKWITDAESLQPAVGGGPHPRANATLLLRREFTVRPPMLRAILHVSGLGQYQLYLNGHRFSDNLLTPGWTDYTKTIFVPVEQHRRAFERERVRNYLRYQQRDASPQAVR